MTKRNDHERTERLEAMVRRFADQSAWAPISARMYWWRADGEPQPWVLAQQALDGKPDGA